jgi:hypothetical protein
MAVATGARTTGNVHQSQRVIDMHKEILLLEPDAAPLTVFLKQIYNGGRRVAAKDPLFSWFNDELEARFDAINNGAGYASGATSLVVDNGPVFPTESLVKVPRTGEVMFVSSVSTNTLTVVRGFGGTTAAALVDNDPLYVIGIADDEDSLSPDNRSENPTKVDNYTQIFKRSVRASGSWLSSSNITSVHDWDHQRKKVAIEHLKDIELSFLFGGPSTQAGTEGPRRTTGGVTHFATQNNQDAGGALTEAEWETFLRTLFRYGSQKKVVLVSPLVLSVLNNYAAGRLQTNVGATTYGVKVMNMVSAHGEVTLVKHNLLEGATYGGYAIALDLKFGNVAYRYLNGDGPGASRDTKLATNIGTPDRDGRKDQWLSECGLQFGLPKAHGVLFGVTS